MAADAASHHRSRLAADRAAVDAAEAREHGLTDGEFEQLCDLLGRAPNRTELGIASSLWSEHCSYKSS
ncbi:MAG: hypothetical protein AAF772_01600, partial [Acidobacteriota bacterium]